MWFVRARWNRNEVVIPKVISLIDPRPSPRRCAIFPLSLSGESDGKTDNYLWRFCGRTVLLTFLPNKSYFRGKRSRESGAQNHHRHAGDVCMRGSIVGGDYRRNFEARLAVRREKVDNKWND